MATPDHPTLTLGDQLVTTIEAAWVPEAPNDAIRTFDPRVTPETAKAELGRRVYVLPIGYRSEPASRVKNKWAHRFLVLTIEKFDETVSGGPDVEWADERVKFVLDLKGWLDFPQASALLKFGTRAVWTETFEEVEIYDPELLSDFGLFWSTIEVVYGEML